MPLLRMGTRFVARRISPTQFLGPTVSVVGMIAVAFMLLTGRIDLMTLDFGNLAAPPSGQPGAMVADGGSAVMPVRWDRVVGQRDEDRIRIATFNIQVFGESKAANPNVMQTLATIVASFDVVAIQEVKSPQAMPVARLVDLINRGGGRYEATVSPPIGRTNQKEQYAFVWDSTRIRLIPDSSYVVNDDAKEDRMHREPMVASFETRVPAAQGRLPFRFTLINAHTDPDEVSLKNPESELNVLDDVFVRVREYEFATHREEDFLLLGDLNVDSAGLGELGQIPGMVSLIGDQPTNTAGTKTYDHILIDRYTTTEFTGRAGVIDYERDLGLTAEQAA
ncbi:MAG: endonuclease/exonuclease/phosphatase family protein, partial [Planctomycetaceae bacterium]